MRKEHLFSAQRAEVQQAITAAVEALLQLEPSNPKALDLAALGILKLSNLSNSDGAALKHRAMNLLLRGVQLARRQRSDYFEVVCGVRAVILAPSVLSDTRYIAVDFLQLLVEVGEAAGPAVRRCKPVLPHAWVHVIEGVEHLSQPTLAALQAELRVHKEQASGSSAAQVAAAKAALRSSIDAAVEAVVREHATSSNATVLCSGCGQYAVGLRRCGRCKAAQYCSEACHRAHWRVHKRDCRAP